MTTTPSANPGSKVLLVYFSRPGENYWYGDRRNLDIGNTKVLAEMIAARIECDSYEIRATDPYPDAYNPTVERNSREQDDSARPAIAGDLPDVSGYGTVLLGSPVWGSRAPMIMSTFVDSVDLAGKEILPFVTYAVSGMSGIDEDYRAALTDSIVADGLPIRGETVADAGPDVESWIAANRLTRR
ncbi:flavodoxin [Rhodococcus rhodochrous]|nr:flavodoxin [Rhodococcus rhodochrous]